MAAAAGRAGLGHAAGWKMLGQRVEGIVTTAWARCLFTRSRIPDSVFQPRPGDHEKYGGDPEQPHKIHVVTRIKSVVGRPYWEKKIIHDLGLDKGGKFSEQRLELGSTFVKSILSFIQAHRPRLHKNIPSVNARLKIVKHLIRIQPLKLPYGLPTEEEMSDTFLTSRGELVIKRYLRPVEQKEMKS